MIEIFKDLIVITIADIMTSCALEDHYLYAQECYRQSTKDLGKVYAYRYIGEAQVLYKA